MEEEEEEEEEGWGVVWEVSCDVLTVSCRLIVLWDFTASDDVMRTFEDTSSPSSELRPSNTTCFCTGWQREREIQRLEQRQHATHTPHMII